MEEETTADRLERRVLRLERANRRLQAGIVRSRLPGEP